MASGNATRCAREKRGIIQCGMKCPKLSFFPDKDLKRPAWARPWRRREALDCFAFDQKTVGVRLDDNEISITRRSALWCRRLAYMEPHLKGLALPKSVKAEQSQPQHGRHLVDVG
jgi:hypothetical protein